MRSQNSILPSSHVLKFCPPYSSMGIHCISTDMYTSSLGWRCVWWDNGYKN